MLQNHIECQIKSIQDQKVKPIAMIIKTKFYFSSNYRGPMAWSTAPFVSIQTSATYLKEWNWNILHIFWSKENVNQFPKPFLVSSFLSKLPNKLIYFNSLINSTNFRKGLFNFFDNVHYRLIIMVAGDQALCRYLLIISQ